MRIGILSVFILFIALACDSEGTADIESKPNPGYNGPLLVEDPNHLIAQDTNYTQGVAVYDLQNDGYPEVYMTNSWVFSPNFYYGSDAYKFYKDTPLTLMETNSNGVCIGDINNDGRDEIFIANGNYALNHFYLATDSGYYPQIIEQFQKDSTWSYGISLADIDADGWVDLYVSNFKNQSNIVYRNNRGNLQELVGHPLCLPGHSTISTAWSDLNNDGLPDAVICGEGKVYVAKNLGGFNFEFIQDSLFDRNKSITYGCSIGDFNNDGLQDLYFANWNRNNFLLTNKGDFTFEDQNLLKKEWTDSEGSCWGDYNNDGWLDLIVGNQGANKLYLNQNGSSFEAQEIIGLTDTARNSNGTVWVDLDNDGDLDLIIASGGNGYNQFFENKTRGNNWVKIRVKANATTLFGTRVSLYCNGIEQHREILSQSGGGPSGQMDYVQHFGLGEISKIDSCRITLSTGGSRMFDQISINQSNTLTFE